MWEIIIIGLGIILYLFLALFAFALCRAAASPDSIISSCLRHSSSDVCSGGSAGDKD